MDQKNIISKTTHYVKKLLSGEGSGHDWWHIFRVTQMAKKLAKKEGADMFVVEMAALLHDIADRKLNNGDEEAGLEKVKMFLSSCIDDQTISAHILKIISSYSYTSHLKAGRDMATIEGKVVQDADRLDALGAIGIARTFSYGGHAGRALYDPAIKPRSDVTVKDYTTAPSPSINHFYEKLLLLKGLMNTNSAKKIAIKRHNYLLEFLHRFYEEWQGKI